MTTALTLLLVQGCLGAFDTLWYHELRLRLTHNPSARKELMLHSTRDFIYSVLFGSLAWLTWDGFWAVILAGLLIFEIIITFQDFLEEDRSRKVPAGERVMHALMGIMYGAFLAYLLPELIIWTQNPAGFTPKSYGLLSWLLTAMAAGVLFSGFRDLMAVWAGKKKTELLQRAPV
jgi:hypothetical protein